MLTPISCILLGIFGLIGAIAMRLLQLWIIRCKRRLVKPTAPVRTLIVLGSGGHTAEMLTIVAGLDPLRYRPRVYVCADTDKLSASAAERLESGRGAAGDSAAAEAGTGEDYSIVRIRRCRMVHQSMHAAILPMLEALLLDSMRLIWREQPQLVLCNGPGTCVPVVWAAWWLRFCGQVAADMRMVFVESFCRVRTVSLSGQMVRPLVDLFVVQWPELGAEGEYLGKIM